MTQPVELKTFEDILDFLIQKYARYTLASDFFVMIKRERESNPQGFHRTVGTSLQARLSRRNGELLRRELRTVYEDITENYGHLAPATHIDLRLRLESVLYQ